MAEGECQLIHREVREWLESACRRELFEWTNPQHPEQVLPASFVVTLIKLTAETGQVSVGEFKPAVDYNYFGLYGLAGAMAVRARELLTLKKMSEKSTDLLVKACNTLEIHDADDVWLVLRLITAVENSFPDGFAKEFATPARRRVNRISKRKLS